MMKEPCARPYLFIYYFGNSAWVCRLATSNGFAQHTYISMGYMTWHGYFALFKRFREYKNYYSWYSKNKAWLQSMVKEPCARISLSISYFGMLAWACQLTKSNKLASTTTVPMGYNKPDIGYNFQTTKKHTVIIMHQINNMNCGCRTW